MRQTLRADTQSEPTTGGGTTLMLAANETPAFDPPPEETGTPAALAHLGPYVQVEYEELSSQDEMLHSPLGLLLYLKSIVQFQGPEAGSTLPQRPYTHQDAAEFLGCDERSVRRWFAYLRGVRPDGRRGRRWIVAEQARRGLHVSLTGYRSSRGRPFLAGQKSSHGRPEMTVRVARNGRPPSSYTHESDESHESHIATMVDQGEVGGPARAAFASRSARRPQTPRQVELVDALTSGIGLAMPEDRDHLADFWRAVDKLDRLDVSGTEVAKRAVVYCQRNSVPLTVRGLVLKQWEQCIPPRVHRIEPEPFTPAVPPGAELVCINPRTMKPWGEDGEGKRPAAAVKRLGPEDFARWLPSHPSPAPSPTEPANA